MTTMMKYVVHAEPGLDSTGTPIFVYHIRERGQPDKLALVYDPAFAEMIVNALNHYDRTSVLRE